MKKPCWLNPAEETRSTGKSVRSSGGGSNDEAEFNCEQS